MSSPNGRPPLLKVQVLVRVKKKNTPPDIEELLGYALGTLGLCYDDFLRLTPGEFSAVCQKYNTQVEIHERAEWERMRMLAWVMIQPYTKKKISPRELFNFEWDKAEVKVSATDDKAALNRIMKRIRGKTQGQTPDIENSKQD